MTKRPAPPRRYGPSLALPANISLSAAVMLPNDEIMDHFPRIPARCPIDEERHNEMYHQKCRAIVEAVVPTLAHYRSDFNEREIQHLRKWLMQDLTPEVMSTCQIGYQIIVRQQQWLISIARSPCKL